jgi:glycosyltransferase involved in cell wall biosynthesis
MKIVVTIATIDPEHGGPARTVPALCKAFARSGADLELVTISEHRREIKASPDDGFITTVIPTDADRYHWRPWAKQFKEGLRKAVSVKEAIIYDVGLWLPSNHFAAQIATQMQTPFVSSPRGMLSDEALRISKWKKKIAWSVYQGRDLKRANVLHATSEAEAHDFRKRKLSQPIAIVSNGVEVPVGIQRAEDSGSQGANFTAGGRELFANRPREAGGSALVKTEEPRTLLFLSRLHPIKGLKDLVTAWARVRPQGWRAVIAGPNENNHQQEIESLAKSLDVRQDFEFVGAVDDEAKWKLLASADLFVLPSYSESFGMAIAEALAAGVPVITTRATPWSDIEKCRCGWWVDTGAGAIAEALSLATAATRQELREMGKGGRELISKNYSWDSAAKNMLSVFEWVLGKAERPASVV